MRWDRCGQAAHPPELFERHEFHEFFAGQTLRLVGLSVDEVDAFVAKHPGWVPSVLRVRPSERLRNTAALGEHPVRVDTVRAACDVVAQRLRCCSDGVCQVAVGGPAAVGQRFQDGVELRPVEGRLRCLADWFLASIDGANVRQPSAVLQAPECPSVRYGVLYVLSGTGRSLKGLAVDLQRSVALDTASVDAH